jgi:hypothetical protein
MRYVYDVPDDFWGEQVFVGSPAEAEMLVVDLTHLLERVRECSNCKLVITADKELRHALNEAVFAMFLHLGSIKVRGSNGDDLGKSI